MSLPAEDEPDGDVHLPHHFYLGLIASLYGFMFLWPAYPLTGGATALIGVFIALDDVLNHFFGVWTPLDWLYKKFLRGRVP